MGIYVSKLVDGVYIQTGEYVPYRTEINKETDIAIESEYPNCDEIKLTNLVIANPDDVAYKAYRARIKELTDLGDARKAASEARAAQLEKIVINEIEYYIEKGNQ